MNQLIKLGKLLDPKDFEKYITEAEKLETVIHKYGKEIVVPDYPCWMQYLNENGIDGSISFTRHTHQHPILREMIDIVIELLTPIFPDSYKPEIERVHFLKTNGSIVAHRDESGRKTCINIGIKNSSSAITKISNDNIHRNFDNNHTDYQIEDGFAYLLNTNFYHAVVGDINTDRYLITYGFGVTFDILKDKIKYPIGE
jgi:hypothetical protein